MRYCSGRALKQPAYQRSLSTSLRRRWRPGQLPASQNISPITPMSAIFRLEAACTVATTLPPPTAVPLARAATPLARATTPTRHAVPLARATTPRDLPRRATTPTPAAPSRGGNLTIRAATPATRRENALMGAKPPSSPDTPRGAARALAGIGRRTGIGGRTGNGGRTGIGIDIWLQTPSHPGRTLPTRARARAPAPAPAPAP